MSFVPGTQPQPMPSQKISLNLGLNTTGGIASFRLPEGTHKLLVSGQEIQFSKDGETMVVLDLKVVETNVPEAMSQNHSEYLVIPGDERKQNNYSSWQIMMKMLRLKLEAMTGTTWRADDLELDPQALVGRTFYATCTHKTTQKKQDDGTVKEYTNAMLGNWTADTNTAQNNGVIGQVGGALGFNIQTPDAAPKVNAADIEPF